jgi:phospholipase D1/2
VILREGENCWRIGRASRVAYLVDAAAYFAAFRHAVLQARRSVIIVGWDVDSRTRLVPQANDGQPTTLLALLNAVLDARPDLKVSVLGWDFSMIYTFEREKLPAYRFAWSGHQRLDFRLDGSHPWSGSHHQKLVVIDDQLAFAGGLDLTIRRWDTPEHRAHHPDRVDPAGAPYHPMHDVQMMVEGPIARDVGDLARARWRAATGEELPPAAHGADGACWPGDVAPDLTDVPVAIARTQPASDDRNGEPGGHQVVHEILDLTLDAIAAARRWIYIENQYLTSAAVGAALAASLAAPAGPEIVAVLPREEIGWLEKSSMGVLRARLLQKLHAADRHGRLRLYHPVIPGLGDGCVNVHSKVFIVDDRLARVASTPNATWPSRRTARPAPAWRGSATACWGSTSASAPRWWRSVWTGSAP